MCRFSASRYIVTGCLSPARACARTSNRQPWWPDEHEMEPDRRTRNAVCTAACNCSHRSGSIIKTSEPSPMTAALTVNRISAGPSAPNSAQPRARSVLTHCTPISTVRKHPRPRRNTPPDCRSGSANCRGKPLEPVFQPQMPGNGLLIPGGKAHFHIGDNRHVSPEIIAHIAADKAATR